MIESNISLRPFNSFGIDAYANAFAAFNSSENLMELLESNRDNKNLLILGGGTNMLFTKNFDGLVLKNEIPGIEVVKEDEQHIYVRTGAGENWHRFVLYCIEKNFAGVENLSLIPGCCGASPMQNIGAYGVEIQDVFQSLEAFHIHDKIPVHFSNSDCQFGYRESVFKNKYKNQFVITQVTYKLNKRPIFNTSYGAIEQELEQMGIQSLSIKAISDAVIRIRQSKLPDPALTGNAGSFFKNPIIDLVPFEKLKEQYNDMPSYKTEKANQVKIPAGWLIEQCGWKGYRKGDAGVHPKQALVLVNYGDASGEEIYTLSENIQQSVKEKFGVSIEREVNII